jgi:hypothetical protein
VSDTSYSHCKDYPIWGLISDKLFKVHGAGGNGANFISPDTNVVEHIGAVGFVDDTTEAINDFTNDSATPSLMVDKGCSTME